MVPPASLSAAPARRSVPPPRHSRAPAGGTRGRAAAPVRAAAVPPPDRPDLNTTRRQNQQQERPSRDHSPAWHRTSVQCSAALVEPVAASAVDCTELLRATWHAGDARVTPAQASPCQESVRPTNRARRDPTYSTYQCGKLWDNNFIAGAPATSPEPAAAAGQLQSVPPPPSPHEALHSVAVSLDMAEQKQRRALQQQQRAAGEGAHGHDGVLDAEQQQQNMDVALSGMQQQQERRERRRRRAARDSAVRAERARQFSQHRALIAGAAQQHEQADTPLREAARSVRAASELTTPLQLEGGFNECTTRRESAHQRSDAGTAHRAQAGSAGVSDGATPSGRVEGAVAAPSQLVHYATAEATRPLPAHEAPASRAEHSEASAAPRRPPDVSFAHTPQPTPAVPAPQRRARPDPDATGVRHWLNSVHRLRQLAEHEAVAPQKVTSLLSHLATFEPSEVEQEFKQVSQSLRWVLEEVRCAHQHCRARAGVALHGLGCITKHALLAITRAVKSRLTCMEAHPQSLLCRRCLSLLKPGTP